MSIPKVNLPKLAVKTEEEKDAEYELLNLAQKFVYQNAPDDLSHDEAILLATLTDMTPDQFIEVDGNIEQVTELIDATGNDDDDVPTKTEATKPLENLGVAKGKRAVARPTRGAVATATKNDAPRPKVATPKPTVAKRVATGKRPMPKRGA